MADIETSRKKENKRKVGESRSIYFSDASLNALKDIREYLERKTFRSNNDSEVIDGSLSIYSQVLGAMDREVQLCPNPTCGRPIKVRATVCNECKTAISWIPLRNPRVPRHYSVNITEFVNVSESISGDPDVKREE
jgi:hypothetical protein